MVYRKFFKSLIFWECLTVEGTWIFIWLTAPSTDNAVDSRVQDTEAFLSDQGEELDILSCTSLFNFVQWTQPTVPTQITSENFLIHHLESSYLTEYFYHTQNGKEQMPASVQFSDLKKMCMMQLLLGKQPVEQLMYSVQGKTHISFSPAAKTVTSPLCSCTPKNLYSFCSSAIAI